MCIGTAGSGTIHPRLEKSPWYLKLLTYRSTPSCQATSVVARERRTEPLGATRAPQAKAGSTWSANRPRAMVTATNLLSIVDSPSSFFIFPFQDFIHYDGSIVRKVPTCWLTAV